MRGKRKHHDLLVWQESMALARDVYRVTADFPGHEVYGLTSQIRRACVSIPSNIAEGAGRTGPRESLKFLSIARGSLCELETQLILANELEYFKESIGLFERIERIFGLLCGLMKSVRSSK